MTWSLPPDVRFSAKYALRRKNPIDCLPHVARVGNRSALIFLCFDSTGTGLFVKAQPDRMVEKGPVLWLFQGGKE
jgi:hypothetical protein